MPLAPAAAAAVARGPTMQKGGMSEAIPFMEKPKNINSAMAGAYQAAGVVCKTLLRPPGMHLPLVDAWILLAGYAGFDPLGFSDYYDIKWLQEAEIKHGRICMLAAVGMVSWL